MAEYDSNTLRARFQRNNANTRQTRRNNRKPRKQAPLVQPQQQAKMPTPVTGAQALTPDVSLDEQVERMRQSTSAPTSTPTEATPEANPFAGVPTMSEVDPKTRAMMMAAILKEIINNPELQKENW